MKKALAVAAVCIIFLSSCDEHQKHIRESQIQAQVDSIAGARLIEINQQAMIDLDHRISIEVKAKADSILEARRKKMIQDTINKAATVNAPAARAINDTTKK